MPWNATPWIRSAGRVGGMPIALLAASRLTDANQIIMLPWESVHAVMSPQVARAMLQRMQRASVIYYRILTAGIKVSPCLYGDVF